MLNGQEDLHRPTAISELVIAVQSLTTCVNLAVTRMDAFVQYSENSMPIKSVYLIFVLVFALIFGIEGVKFLFNDWLPHLLGKS